VCVCGGGGVQVQVQRAGLELRVGVMHRHIHLPHLHAGSSHRDCQVNIIEPKRGWVDVPSACECQRVVTAGTQLCNNVGEDGERLTNPCDVVSRVANGLVCTNLRSVELRQTNTCDVEMWPPLHVLLYAP
jgi:hypothetical protein